MTLTDHIVFWIAGLIALALVFNGLTNWFSRDSRMRQKRRRNYRPVSAKARRPIVLLSVKTKQA